jgi:hypothetical protein
MSIIAGLKGRGKQALSRVPDGALVAATLVLASSASFGLGFISGREAGEKGEVQILEREIAEATLGAPPAAPVASAAVVSQAAVPVTAGGQYVASRNGSKYYLPFCGSVKNIKEENKVWFATKEEAEAKGYQPAANCPGL